ncbi:RNA polymerase sigma factor [Vallitalea sp.]|jgi:RNA polymerase sigma-70 factor (ECF subfamily)|uniref:RNA polymerase sigma factor n=1 Tax=Vallitalea sp. TaxID=1882829 RepID=UPI0025D5898D|nr:sigma-70 family RNA polymerase sigma factor [Vallitalea sp.]MCT4687114.1 sigma-70 family RNA polymerase sigma factor [Vallitalea sp.]
MLETDEDKVKIIQIYERYEGLVFYIAHDFLRNQQDAEDATHDAFLKIAKNIDCIEEVLSHKTKGFVVIVIENVCKDFLKKKKKVKLTSLEQMEYGLATDEDVETSVIESITAEILREKVDELEPIHQEALMLRYLKQLSYDEMSNILGLKNSAVRKRVQRSRDILAKKLNERDIER